MVPQGHTHLAYDVTFRDNVNESIACSLSVDCVGNNGTLRRGGTQSRAHFISCEWGLIKICTCYTGCACAT